MKKIKNPTQRKKAPVIPWEQEQFLNVYQDAPASEIPEYSLTEAQNVLCRGAWAEVRPGTKLWAAANLPALKENVEFSAGGRPLTPLPTLDGRDNYQATKSGTTITKTAGEDFSSSDVGSFFVWPDGIHDLIMAVIDDDNITVRSSTSHSAATADNPGRMRGPINCKPHWHDESRRLFIHIDTRVFYTDYLMSEYTQVYCRSLAQPANVKSDFDENKDFVYLFANGVFQIDTTDWEMYKINEPVPENTISREEMYRTALTETEYETLSPSENDEYIYGRKYLFSMSRLDGTGFRNRGTEDTAIRKETGTNAVRPGDGYRDYKEAWYRDPVFSKNGQYVEVIVGGAITNVIDDFIDVVEGSARIGINVDGANEVRNVVVHFGSAKDFYDVARMMEEAIIATFPDADGMPDNPPICRYVDDHFIFHGGNYDSSDVTNVWQAGTVGTDVSGYFGMTVATGSDVYYYTTSHILGKEDDWALQMPSNQRQWTHYSAYSSRYINDPAINDIQYIWQEDVPVAKAFIVDVMSTYGSLAPAEDNILIEALTGTFQKMDIGCYLKLETGASYLMQQYVDSSNMRVYPNNITVVVSWDISIRGVAACIGDGKIGRYSQTDDIVTRFRGDYFSTNDVGKTLFWADGTYGYVIEYLGATRVRVETNATHTEEAMTWDPVGRNYNDIITDDILKARAEAQNNSVNYFLLKQRFWKPLPDTALGVIGPLFMYVANREGDQVYYSEMAPLLAYLAGHHRSEQRHTVKDAIMAMAEFPDRIILYCSSSTLKILTNTTNQVVDEIGIVMSVISGISNVDPAIGIKNKGSIARLPDGRQCVITSEPAVKIFDGYKYGENLAQDENGIGKIQNLVERLQAIVSSGYDRLYGYVFWANDNDENVVDFNLSWRKGITVEQAPNWMEFIGEWIYPEPEIGIFNVFNERDQKFSVVFDMYSGLPYMITSREGPVGSEIVKVWKDKVGPAYEAGYEIPWAFKPKEHRGKKEDDLINHLESHLRLRPQDEANQGREGYDSQGFRNAQEITVQAFEEGSETEVTRTRDIPSRADIAFDKQIKAHRIQLRFSGTASEIKFVSHSTKYEDQDIRGAPIQRVMTEQIYQEELCDPTFWLSRGASLVDRASGNSPTGSIFGYCEGPDGESDSGIIFASASELTFPHSYSYSGDFSIMFTVSNILVSTEILRVGSMIIRIEVSGGSYTISFNDGNETYEQLLDWNGEGWCSIKITRNEEDLIFSENGSLLNREMLESIETISGDVDFQSSNAKRLYDARIYDDAISENANNYYYSDVNDKQGVALLPL